MTGYLLIITNLWLMRIAKWERKALSRQGIHLKTHVGVLKRKWSIHECGILQPFFLGVFQSSPYENLNIPV